MPWKHHETSSGPQHGLGYNIKKAKEAGLKVGVYVYTSASTKEEAISQAKFIKKHLNKTKLDFH